MKRGNARGLFSHVQREHLENGAADAEGANDEGHGKGQAQKDSERRSSKTGSSPPVPAPGQKTLTSFFQKRPRDETPLDPTDESEWTTVDKRSRVDKSESKELPCTFLEWDKEWGEGTAGLNWKKSPRRDETDGSITDQTNGLEPSNSKTPRDRPANALKATPFSVPHKSAKQDETDCSVSPETKGHEDSDSEPPRHRPANTTKATASVPAKSSGLIRSLLDLDDEDEEVSPLETTARSSSQCCLGNDSILSVSAKDPGDAVRNTGALKNKGGTSAFLAPIKPSTREFDPSAQNRLEPGTPLDTEKDTNSEVSILLQKVANFPGCLPPDFNDTWDNKHVRLPCSARNKSHKTQICRWDKVRDALWPPGRLKCFSSLRHAILSYMSGASALRDGDGEGGGGSSRYSFSNLQATIEEDLSESERSRFFGSTIVHMVRIALELPSLCREPIPLLRAGSSKEVHLNSLQVASLLANAFFCTFPGSAAREQTGKFPYFNFTSIFEADKVSNSSKRHKLLCLLHYFDRIARRLDCHKVVEHGDEPWGEHGARLKERCIAFKRRVLIDNISWESSNTSFSPVQLRVRSKGTIEDFDPTGQTWQVDFANCMIGGGVLGRGAVQEEIRFVLSPELIVSRLLTEELGPREAVLIVGTERFSNYRGFASSFQFAGDHVDRAETDTSGNFLTTVVAMDAIFFYRNEYLHQFRNEALRRELDKAFCAFASLSDHRLRGQRPSPDTAAVATGNWGCGVFGGDPFLKGLLQIMAAAEAGRKLVYLTFQDERLTLQLEEVFNVLVRSGCTVQDVFLTLRDFRPDPSSKPPTGAGQELRKHLLNKFRDRSRESTP